MLSSALAILSVSIQLVCTHILLKWNNTICLIRWRRSVLTNQGIDNNQEELKIGTPRELNPRSMVNNWGVPIKRYSGLSQNFVRKRTQFYWFCGLRHMAQRILKVLRHFMQICAYGAGRGSFLGPVIKVTLSCYRKVLYMYIHVILWYPSYSNYNINKSFLTLSSSDRRTYCLLQLWKGTTKRRLQDRQTDDKTNDKVIPISHSAMQRWLNGVYRR